MPWSPIKIVGTAMPSCEVFSCFYGRCAHVSPHVSAAAWDWWDLSGGMEYSHVLLCQDREAFRSSLYLIFHEPRLDFLYASLCADILKLFSSLCCSLQSLYGWTQYFLLHRSTTLCWSLCRAVTVLRWGEQDYSRSTMAVWSPGKVLWQLSLVAAHLQAARPHPGRACLSSQSVRSWADCRACILLLAMAVAWSCVMGLKGGGVGSPFPPQACGRQAGCGSDPGKSRGTIPFAFISWAEDGSDFNQSALHCKNLPSIIWCVSSSLGKLVWTSAVETLCGVWKKSFSSQERGKSFWICGNSQHLQSVCTVFSSPQSLQVFVWPFMFSSSFSKPTLASRNAMLGSLLWPDNGKTAQFTKAWYLICTILDSVPYVSPQKSNVFPVCLLIRSENTGTLSSMELLTVTSLLKEGVKNPPLDQ